MEKGGSVLPAEIIDGKALANAMRQEMKEEVRQLRESGLIPGLAVIIVGNDPASETYVNSKAKACAQIGIHSEVIRLPEETDQQELLRHIDRLNNAQSIDGILVQLPLPGHISENAVVQAISPAKDVDGFHPENVGRLVIGQNAFLPCTPHGIIKMIQATQTDIAGKEVVIVGRSNIVGKPLALLFLQEHATVTVCHSRTERLPEKTKAADILVVAAGKAGMIGQEHVKEGAIVIDVGINRTKEGKLCGDVRFEEVRETAGLITPVPGGVGPMTITMLLYNTLQSAKNRKDAQSDR